MNTSDLLTVLLTAILTVIILGGGIFLLVKAIDKRIKKRKSPGQ